MVTPMMRMSVAAATAYLLLASFADAGSTVPPDQYRSCFDNAMVEISEEALGRKYSLEERKLKLQAMHISPEWKYMGEMLDQLAQMGSLTLAHDFLVANSPWEDWMISITTSCVFLGRPWS